MDAHHVAVRDLPREQQLLLEASLQRLCRHRIRAGFGPDHLHRHHHAELGVPGLIHGTHAAETQQFDDVVALAEILARHERAVRIVGV
jgi:hypothetical protein